MFSVILFAQLAIAQGLTQVPPAADRSLALASDSKLWIEGDSNFHKWTCKAAGVTAIIDADSSAQQPARNLQIDVPVQRLECGNDTMNGKLRDALKSKQNPAIEYRLGPAQRVAGDGIVLQTTGALTIAGKTRDVTFRVEAAINPDGSIYAMGKVPLKMSDFGVEPPSAMLGTLKTYDAITVRFELHTLPKVIAHASLP